MWGVISLKGQIYNVTCRISSLAQFQKPRPYKYLPNLILGVQLCDDTKKDPVEMSVGEDSSQLLGYSITEISFTSKWKKEM